MTRMLRRWLLVSVVTLNVCVLIAFGVSLLHVRKERAGLQAENREVSEKAALMQKKYRDEKARVEGLQRSQTSLEGQKRTLQGELAKLKEENASLLEQRGESQKALAGKVASLTARLEEVSRRSSELQAAHQALQAESAREKKDLEERMNRVAEQNRGLEEELKKQEQGLARCRDDNRELCGLVDDLLAKYEGKGVVTSILQKEPFTQMERAEVEKLMQEYQDKKAKHSMERLEEQAHE